MAWAQTQFTSTKNSIVERGTDCAAAAALARRTLLAGGARAGRGLAHSLPRPIIVRFKRRAVVVHKRAVVVAVFAAWRQLAHHHLHNALEHFWRDVALSLQPLQHRRESVRRQPRLERRFRLESAEHPCHHQPLERVHVRHMSAHLVRRAVDDAVKRRRRWRGRLR
eukprot:scaffold56166_cov64-Phaeocystis_antarctica.AAC.7